MTERQELHCHNCNQYVQFNLDLEVDGNYVLDCPKCGHEHCRTVVNGRITESRWDSRNDIPVGTSYFTVSATTASTSNYSIDQTSTASSAATQSLWIQVS